MHQALERREIAVQGPLFQRVLIRVPVFRPNRNRESVLSSIAFDV
jgi:hypothetical protein